MTLRFVLLSVLVTSSACEVNRWGDICETDDDCESSELVCFKADDLAVSGVCRNAEGELRCGPGTVLEVTPGTAECVVDPESPPNLVCGEGTVEVDRVCRLPE